MDINAILTEAIENHQLGNLQGAEHLYKKTLLVQPDNFYALQYLGVLYCQCGKYVLALEHIEKALQLNPCDSHAHYNLGIALQGQERSEEAITSYQKAIQLSPENADAYVNLAMIWQAKGQLDDAITCYQKALKINPDHFLAYNNLGTALRQQGKLDEAILYYQKAIQSNHKSAETYGNLGSALQEKGHLDDAVNIYHQALQIKPGSPEILFKLGTALVEQGRKDEALKIFDRIIVYQPDSLSARFAHCIAQVQILHPNKSDVHISRKNYHDELIALRDSLAFSSQEALREASKVIGTMQPFYLAYQGLNDRELQKMYGDIICRVMATKFPHFAVQPEMPSYSLEQPIRIGFVSGFFYNHSVWKFPIKGWIENIDKDRFELYGYYTWKKKDAETVIARQHFSQFIEDVHSFEDLCFTIREHNLHILVFAEIGMDPMTARISSLKLSPIQCVSWGHPTTSGLPTVDYYLSSDLIEPPDGEEHYTEHLIRLPNLSGYYSPTHLHSINLHRDALGLRKDSILYHCCQSPFKYLPQYDEVFPRIAREVGNCQFLFSSYAKSTYLTEQFRKRIRDTFLKFKLNADDFIVFLPFLEVQKYNALYRLADVFLDPVGWSGCNSTLEAISFNIPVVTFPGKLMRSRDAFAILNMMDVRETIASSLDNYIEIAVRLGNDSDNRKRISIKIADNKHRFYHDKAPITALEKFFESVVKERLSR